MRTTQWQLSFEGLVLSQESHAWEAGIHFAQHEDYFNIQQAGTRRPVRARLSHAVCADRRFGRIVLTPAGFCTPVETIGIEVDFPVCQSACKRDPLSARKRDPLSGWRSVDVTGFLALRAA